MLKKVQKLNSYKIDYKGINLISLSQIYVFELSLNRFDRSKFIDLLKIFSLDSYLKALFSISFNKKTKPSRIEYLFVNDIYNYSMINTLRTVEASFPKPYIEVICDKRIKKAKSNNLFNYWNFFLICQNYFRVFMLLVRNFKIVRALSREFNINVNLIFLNLLESAFIISCVEKMFRDNQKLKKVILNSDVHKVSRTINLIAQKFNIKTYVLQHGSTVLEYGYLPVSANKMLTWGSLSSKWFEERGVNKKKLQVTGTPKTDLIHKYPIEKVSEKKVSNILVVLNPIGESKVEEFIRLIYNAKLIPNYKITFKLHPGSVDNNNLVYKYFDKSEIKVCKHESIHDLIFNGDLVITTTSTVGNEAIAFHKPLIKIDILKTDSKMEYEQFDCCFNIDDASELNSLIKNTSKLHSKIKNYKNFIEKYFYKLDGKSTKRIIKLITA
ncbi:hypothetical protein EYD45_14685 [Hyunsoonleella flava]|uniref:Uncharacterized protein n=1 Tax=Hyunsoonleella flava TaxID=2527939 RepID=A0A4V2J9T8_9FLAO|nr:CDP-glycerol glycerophosphotransferase family protein [Hyunsoonleella flava]TBN00182.1 hypothetical protein EYD45_14685 [Hyunsoonleella flava]